MWSLMAAPDGSRFLLNLDCVVGFAENKIDGTAIAVALSGMSVPLGVQLDQVIADCTDDEGDQVTGADAGAADVVR